VGGGWPGGMPDSDPCIDAEFFHDGVTFRTFRAGNAGRYCVLRVVSATGGSMLLAGDIDAGAERHLLARVGGAALASEAVLTSRRTSAAGSSPQWIEALRPGLVIATGGVDGAVSRTAVIDRWRRRGARIIDTRHDGGVELEIARGVRIRATARDSRYPFIWRRPPV
jgi:competence protein ComEC